MIWIFSDSQSSLPSKRLALKSAISALTSVLVGVGKRFLDLIMSLMVDDGNLGKALRKKFFFLSVNLSKIPRS